MDTEVDKENRRRCRDGVGLGEPPRL